MAVEDSVLRLYQYLVLEKLREVVRGRSPTQSNVGTVYDLCFWNIDRVWSCIRSDCADRRPVLRQTELVLSLESKLVVFTGNDVAKSGQVLQLQVGVSLSHKWVPRNTVSAFIPLQIVRLKLTASSVIVYEGSPRYVDVILICQTASCRLKHRGGLSQYDRALRVHIRERAPTVDIL